MGIRYASCKVKLLCFRFIEICKSILYSRICPQVGAKCLILIGAARSILRIQNVETVGEPTFLRRKLS